MQKIGEVLFLSRSDVEGILTPKDALDICDKTFKWINEGGVSQIHTERLNTPSSSGPKDGSGFIIYPAHINPLGAVGLKWLSEYPSNIPKGLPLIMATDILNDAQTGAPMAIMDGMFITAMRTAGHSAVGAKYLAKKDSGVIAIVGCGFEGRTHLRVMNELFQIREVRVCDTVIPTRDKFCREMGELLNLDIRPFETVEEAVKGADVICEVTTSMKPTIRAEWVEAGCYIAAPNPFGIEPGLTKKADKWVIGNWEIDLPQIETDSDFSRDDIYASLDEVAAGKKPGRETDEEITLMIHYGMGALDVSAMQIVYNMAIKKRVGTQLKLF